MKGQTSRAPIRGCSPVCCFMSIRGKAALAAFRAPSTILSGPPTKVKTVRCVDSPGSTSKSVTPGVALMEDAIASITCSDGGKIRIFWLQHYIHYLTISALREIGDTLYYFRHLADEWQCKCDYPNNQSQNLCNKFGILFFIIHPSCWRRENLILKIYEWLSNFCKKRPTFKLLWKMGYYYVIFILILVIECKQRISVFCLFLHFQFDTFDQRQASTIHMTLATNILFYFSWIIQAIWHVFNSLTLVWTLKVKKYINAAEYSCSPDDHTHL